MRGTANVSPVLQNRSLRLCLRRWAPKERGEKSRLWGGPFPPLEKRRALKKKKKVHFRSTQGTDDPLPCNNRKKHSKLCFPIQFLHLRREVKRSRLSIYASECNEGKFCKFHTRAFGEAKNIPSGGQKNHSFRICAKLFFSQRLLVCCPLSPFSPRQQILYNTIFFAPQPVRKVPSFLDSCILSAKARFICCTLALSCTKRTRIKKFTF